MGAILALLGLLGFLALCVELLKTTDNRETFLRDKTGRALALYLAGPIGASPPHEQYIHDGTPHQNPVVYSKVKFGWFNQEIWLHSYYPLTVSPDGRRGDLAELQARIEKNPPKTGTVEIRPMPGWAVKRALRVEDATQRRRGVADNRLLTSPWKQLEALTAPLFWFGLATIIGFITFMGLTYAY